LLEKTATIRPFFFGVIFCPAENSAVLSSTVLNSSAMMGRRRNSRAPARILRKIRSGEALRAAEMIAVCGLSVESFSIIASACSEFASDIAMTTAVGRKFLISA
jgi:hypothetical protein